MDRAKSDAELTRLLENLVNSANALRKSKKTEDPVDLVYEIYHMTQNRVSRVLSDSATWISPEVANTLLEQGFIQRIMDGTSERYALTFKGMAYSVRLKHDMSLEAQFLRFLELSDRNFTTAESGRLIWKEKLASLSLILMVSTSPNSAIRLNNPVNKTALGDVFERVLACFKKFSIVGEKTSLGTTSRGETPVSALMSRLNDLPRKTSFYYTNLSHESGYYFDLEKDGEADAKKLRFLFGRIFDEFDPQCRYFELNGELAEISHLFSPRFIARSVNANVALGVSRGLKEYLEQEIWRMPPKSPES